MQSALVICAFLVTAWFSYDYGRSQSQLAAVEASIAPARESEHTNTALEKERDRLRHQVAKVEQELEQAQQDLRAAQARIQTLQKAASTQREAAVLPAAQIQAPVSAEVASTSSEPETQTTGAKSADNTLKLDNVRIRTTQSEKVFRISFSVAHLTDISDQVTGTIWIAVNGISGGQPKRLSFKRLSTDRRSYVKMGFEQRQDVKEDLVLPDNFLPKNVLIEAKPYGNTYTGTSGKFSWSTAG